MSTRISLRPWRRARQLLGPALLLVAACLIAACGGGGDDTANDDTFVEETTTTEAAVVVDETTTTTEPAEQPLSPPTTRGPAPVLEVVPVEDATPGGSTAKLEGKKHERTCTGTTVATISNPRLFR